MLSKLSVDQKLMKAKSFEKKGNFVEAEKLYNNILENFTSNKRAYFGLENLKKIKKNNVNLKILPQEEINDLERLYNLGKFSLTFKKANSLSIQYPEILTLWNILGASALQIGMLDNAITAFKKVILINPNHVDAHNNLGVALKNQGRFDEAIESFQRVLKIKNDYVDAYYNLGNIFWEQGKYNESVEYFKKSILLKPNYAEAYCNMGVSYKDQGKYDEAIEAYKKSISIKPDNARAFSNIGSVLQNQGEFEKAIQAYKNSILLDPNLANTHKNLSFALLSHGSYDEGLAEYEWRWKTDEFLSEYRNFSQPLWNKKIPLKGKTILIWSEQGVGDTITWSSCISYVASQAKHCILECQEKLVPLLKRSFPKIEVRAADKSYDTKRNDFDFHIPMGSLYKNLNTEIFYKTKVDAYLTPDPDRVDFWKKRLNSLGQGPYIGVSWKSSNMDIKRLPNYATISELYPVLKVPDVTYINLQYNDFANNLTNIKKELGVTIHNFDDLDHFNNIDDVASLYTALDMVVSTKSTVPLISAGVGTLTKLANWKQSAWNNILLNPRGPLVQIYERNTWETWDNIFNSIVEDISKLTNEGETSS